MHGNNIYYLSKSWGVTVQVTTDGKPLDVYNGIPDWLYEGKLKKKKDCWIFFVFFCIDS